jgi:hypothetical protein
MAFHAQPGVNLRRFEANLRSIRQSPAAESCRKFPLNQGVTPAVSVDDGAAPQTKV